MLRDVAAEQGRAVVLITHDPSIAQSASRLVRMRDGRISAGAERPVRPNCRTVRDHVRRYVRRLARCACRSTACATYGVRRRRGTGTCGERLVEDRRDASLVVDAIGSSLMLMFERDATGHRDHATSATRSSGPPRSCSTVSSQMPNPVTTGGRIVDMFLMAYAITVVATLAGSFGSYFQRHDAARRSRGNVADPRRLPQSRRPPPAAPRSGWPRPARRPPGARAPRRRAPCARPPRARAAPSRSAPRRGGAP